MAAVAALARRVEARTQLGGVASRTGVAHHFRGQGQAQQQHVSTAAVLQQGQHLGRAPTIQQKVGMRGQQVDIGPTQRLGFVEGTFGRNPVTEAFFDFRQAGQAPKALGGIGRGRSQCLAQGGGGGPGAAGGGVQLRVAGSADERRRQWGQGLATDARTAVVAAHHLDGQLPGPGAAVVRLQRQHGCQVRQRGIELVIELQHLRTQHAHRHRRIGQGPPGLQRGLGAADVTRVAGGAHLVKAAFGQAQRGGQVLRLRAPGLPQRLQFTRCRVAGAGGHALQHLGFVAGGEGRRLSHAVSTPACEAGCQTGHEEWSHGAHGSGCAGAANLQTRQGNHRVVSTNRPNQRYCGA